MWEFFEERRLKGFIDSEDQPVAIAGHLIDLTPHLFCYLLPEIRLVVGLGFGVCGSGFTFCVLWCMVYGVWCMVYGLWFMVDGSRSMVYCSLFMVYGS